MCSLHKGCLFKEQHSRYRAALDAFLITYCLSGNPYRDLPDENVPSWSTLIVKVDGLGKRVRSLGSNAGPRIILCVPRVYCPVERGKNTFNISKMCDRLYIGYINFGEIVRRGSYALLLVDKLPSRSLGKCSHQFFVSSVELVLPTRLGSVSNRATTATVW